MFFACVAVVILSLSWVITTLIELPAKRAAASSLAALSASQAASSQADGSVAQTGEAVLGPVQQTDASYTQPSASLVALPEYSSGIPNAKYAAYLGAGPKQFMEGLVENISGQQVAAIDEILAAAPKKVYILLGTNSMATLTDEAFLKYYNDFLDFLLPQLPIRCITSRASRLSRRRRWPGTKTFQWNASGG